MWYYKIAKFRKNKGENYERKYFNGKNFCRD